MKIAQCPYCGATPKTQKTSYFIFRNNPWETFCNALKCPKKPCTPKTTTLAGARRLWNEQIIIITCGDAQPVEAARPAQAGSESEEV